VRRSILVTQVDELGRFGLSQIRYTFRLFLMAYFSVKATIIDQSQGLRTIFSVVSAQIYFTGWQAMPLITVLALASGSVVIMQSTSEFNLLGGSSMVGTLMVAIIIREVAPLLTALVVVARSGTAVASEIGNMRANREIEALESMGINPLSYIVFPRLVGGVISTVALCIMFILISILGGFVVTALVQGMSFQFYIDSVVRAVSGLDMSLFILKNIFSGLIIFSVCSYQGLLVKKSPTEVPVVTTQAVVKSIIYVIVFNMSVTAIFYFYQLSKMGVI
jgi:phospholipid/cholesterol/gamma-HCH transport system permease protein